MTGTNLKGQPWLGAPSTRTVIAALEAAGGIGCARFVGGCVRNSLMDQPVDDIDIASILTPDQVMAAMKAAGLKFVPTGVEHGTVTAIADGKPFEITTLRRDVVTDGRRAVVAFTTDWGEDAKRRDFTFNALYADGEGRVFDPTGQGLADAAAGRVVFVGQADQRIAEDYLRILRYFRFLAWYGRGQPDAAALAACAAGREGLAQISAERIGKEMMKLLAAPDPRAALGLMAESGVLGQVLAVAEIPARFGVMVEISSDPLLRLAALLPDDPLAGEGAWRALRLSNAQRDRLVAALVPASELQGHMSELEARRAIYRLGRKAFEDRLRLNAGALAAPLLSRLKGWSPPPLPVSGADALSLGVAPGPKVGEALAAVEAWWIGEDFQPDRAAALEKLRAVVGA